MRQANETHQSDWIMPPMVGGILCLAASGTEVDIDLTTVAGSTAKSKSTVGMEDFTPNPIGHYLNLQADGGDVYVAFAAALGSLGTLSTSAVTAVANNKPAATNTATGTIKIPNNSVLQVKLPVGSAPTNAQQDNADVGIFSPARYLGFLTATGTATLRIWQSSP